MSVHANKQNDEYLIELVACVIEQRDVLVNHPRPDWDRIFKMSDYHHVANIVYYKVMWSENARLKQLKERFETRYRYCVQLQERYEQVRKSLEAELEKAQIESLFIGESIYLTYYPYSEMRMPQSVQLLVEKHKIPSIYPIMEKMGFEEQEKEEGTGICFHKIPDLTIEVYDNLEFSDKDISMWFRNILIDLPRKEKKRYIKEMNIDIAYIYSICNLAEKFSHGQIELRDLTDFWVFLSREESEIRWKRVQKELEDFKLDEFAAYVVKLVKKWFVRSAFLEDARVLGDMQRFVITKGEEARPETEAILPLVKKVADSYYKDLKKEERKKMREMKYPGLDYMKHAFPILEKYPFLLPVCWMIRARKQKSIIRQERKKRKEEKET